MSSIKVTSGSSVATKLISALYTNKFTYSLEFFQVDSEKVRYYSPSQSFLAAYEFVAFGKNIDELISLANSKCKNILKFNKIDDTLVSVLDKTNSTVISRRNPFKYDYQVFIISPISETSLVFPDDTIGEYPYFYYGFHNHSFTDDIIYPQLGCTNYDGNGYDRDDYGCDYIINERSSDDLDAKKKTIGFVNTLRTFLDCKM